MDDTAYKDIKIRLASLEDAAELLSIYQYYVINTAISFEYEVPTLEEFKRRIGHTLKFYPYIVAEAEGRILGYAYASRLGERKAYDYAAELSVYVHKDMRHRGIGKLLYKNMEMLLKRMNVYNLYACIAYPRDENDSYLTKNSAQFHEHEGFRLAARFQGCGYKFGRWYDIIWMEKILKDKPQRPEPIKAFSEILKDPEVLFDYPDI